MGFGRKQPIRTKSFPPRPWNRVEGEGQVRSGLSCDGQPLAETLEILSVGSRLWVGGAAADVKAGWFRMTFCTSTQIHWLSPRWFMVEKEPQTRSHIHPKGSMSPPVEASSLGSGVGGHGKISHFYNFLLSKLNNNIWASFLSSWC